LRQGFSASGIVFRRWVSPAVIPAPKTDIARLLEQRPELLENLAEASEGKS